ncbi:chemotaxis protein CheA [Sphingomonas qomolangmaensis]|uniref:histidine kinase n=1 Tax=Sphingomonas qomolangmaensis TaxID=2918765 RepID=A0ABY5LG26_9SPHN|nr:ATP-binding protein [Sphingomonas qomolangmaensis]UUL83656.1 chemotaxis protein CheW [Sphingomonas qomolangmaensis]
MDDLLQEFIAETRETLEALSGEVVAWEAAPDDRARLDSIFRFVHTVKGSCGFLDLPRLQRLSHAAEDVLAQVRDGDRRPDRGLVNAVLAIIDRIGEIVEAIDAGVALDDSGEDHLIAALDEGAREVAVVETAITPRAPARSVRLSVDLLDRMMGGMSDMVLARNELARRMREGDLDPSVEAALERMSATVTELRDTVTRTRMQKIDGLFSALPRMVRDTAAGVGKLVTLCVEGADVELDREMIEVMRDPLAHIIRNAIDHGIESPTERLAAGKRDHGRLTVSARQAGNQIVLEIADDGRGIDVDRVIAKLVAAGRSERELRALPDRAKLGLIFEAGMTTKDEVSAVSGRGVGMDVVRACVEQIGGRIELDNAPGTGLRIAIHVPLTLSIIATIIVGLAEHRFAVPRSVIEEIVAERGNAVRIDRIGGSQVAQVRDRLLPVVELRDLLGIDALTERATPGMLLIVGIGTSSFALAVDSVIDAEELVIKPAAPAVMAAGVYAGQTMPDSGQPMLLLDCAGIADVAGLRFQREQLIEAPEDPVEQIPMMKVLLFIDLDGVRRAVALSVVDRIEQVASAAVSMAAGRLRLTLASGLLSLVAQGPLPEATSFPVLRLKDDRTEVGYAILEAADIVEIPQAFAPAATSGAVAGASLIGGEPVELLDPFWLFAQHGDLLPTAERPLFLIEPDAAGWMPSFLAPILNNAGYRVATEAGNDDRPAAVLRLEGEPANEAGVTSDLPVVLLRHERSGDSGIYRYDREGLLEALRDCSRRAGGAPR